MNANEIPTGVDLSDGLPNQRGNNGVALGSNLGDWHPRVKTTALSLSKRLTEWASAAIIITKPALMVALSLKPMAERFSSAPLQLKPPAERTVRISF